MDGNSQEIVDSEFVEASARIIMKKLAQENQQKEIDNEMDITQDSILQNETMDSYDNQIYNTSLMNSVHKT